MIFDRISTLTLNPSDTVLCDFCSTDFTDSDIQGGVYFCGRATCPDCAKTIPKEELYLITQHCPKGMTFKQFVTNLNKEGF